MRLHAEVGLPVLRQEIGDSWIHGVGSDPVKVSRYRELLRLRREWLASNPALQEDEKFDRFQRRLLLVPEHTWGMDEKTFLGDHENYAAAEFNAARPLSNFQVFEASWSEKRAYITSAQLEKVKLGQRVKVMTDYGDKHRKTYDGTVTWISDRSEFTPKTILTDDERADLVYAVKIAVRNDGYIKIGMYGEVKL